MESDFHGIRLLGNTTFETSVFHGFWLWGNRRQGIRLQRDPAAWESGVSLYNLYALGVSLASISVDLNLTKLQKFAFPNS